MKQFVHTKSLFQERETAKSLLRGMRSTQSSFPDAEHFPS